MRKHTGVSIAREVTRPLDEGRALELAGRDSVAANSRQNRGIGEIGLGGDDAVGDVVVDSLQEL